MTECEKAIGKIEEILVSFQENLDSVASEILELQKQAKENEETMKKVNYQQNFINKFINDVSLQNNFVNILKTHSIDDPYIQYLKEFSMKSKSIETYKKREIKAALEVLPQFDNLTKFICGRLNEWIQQKYTMAFKDIESLMAIHHQLMHYNFTFEFLLDNNPSIASNLTNQYVSEASNLYFQKFKVMCKQTTKMYNVIATKDDMIVHSGSLLSSFFSKSTQKSNVHSLGDRLEYVSKLDMAHPFPSKIDTKKNFEYFYRCIFYHLKEYISEEIVFANNFLKVDSTPKIFHKSISNILHCLDTYIESSYDMIGLFLIAIITYIYQKELTDKYKSSMKAFDTYFYKIYEKLVKRCTFIFNANLESIQKSNPVSNPDVHPLSSIRIYSELLLSMITLIVNYPEPLKIFKLKSKLKYLRSEVEKYISKHANAFEDKQKMIMFFINNYDVMQKAISDFEGTDHEANFSVKLNGFISQLSNSILISEFGYIVKFVQDNTVIDFNTRDVNFKDPTADPRYVEELLKKFNESWKKKMENINNMILNNLGTNLRNGLAVLELLMKDLLFYYNILIKLIKLHYKSLQNSKLIVTETEISYELKSYLAILGKKNSN